METEREINGAESSSQAARTRTLGSFPFQLDAGHSAAQAGQLDATQRPAVLTDEGRAAAHRNLGSKVDTATGEGLRSPSSASAPFLGY